MKKIGILAKAAALATVGVLAITPVAHATSDSDTVSYPNGIKLTANAWIQSFTWTSCGSFTSSAVIGAKPNYITNQTSFYDIGLGSVSLKGLSIESSRSGSSSLVWTNSNGSKGSYLSGTVCGGWGSVYVGMDVNAKAFYYGNLRIASAHI